MPTFFRERAPRHVCKSVSLWCTAEPCGEIVSGPLRTPRRRTWSSVHSHLLSAPWSRCKAGRVGAELLPVAPLTASIDSLHITNTGWLIWSYSSDFLAQGKQSEGGGKGSWRVEPTCMCCHLPINLTLQPAAAGCLHDVFIGPMSDLPSPSHWEYWWEGTGLFWYVKIKLR